MILLSFTIIAKSQVNENNNVVAKNNDWIKYSTKEGKFTIEFPQNPKLSNSSFQAATGVRETYWFTVNQPGKQFAISYTDYQNLPKMDEEKLNNNYDNLRNGITKQFNAEITSDKQIWLGTHLGRELEITIKNEIVINRMFLINQRLYQTIITIPKLNNDMGEVKKFLNSFKVEK